MEVIWTKDADIDRENIFAYIVVHNRKAAKRLDMLFSKSATLLSDNPLIGKEGLIEGTREIFPHRNYRMVYEIFDEKIFILAIVHAARQWPPLNKE